MRTAGTAGSPPGEIVGGTEEDGCRYTVGCSTLIFTIGTGESVPIELRTLPGREDGRQCGLRKERGVRILLVEDDDMIAEVIREGLEASRYHVEVAADGDT